MGIQEKDLAVAAMQIYSLYRERDLIIQDELPATLLLTENQALRTKVAKPTLVNVDRSQPELIQSSWQQPVEIF